MVIFRQHAASIYGFVRFVCLCVCVPKKICVSVRWVTLFGSIGNTVGVSPLRVCPCLSLEDNLCWILAYCLLRFAAFLHNIQVINNDQSYPWQGEGGVLCPLFQISSQTFKQLMLLLVDLLNGDQIQPRSFFQKHLDKLILFFKFGLGDPIQLHRSVVRWDT